MLANLPFKKQIFLGEKTINQILNKEKMKKKTPSSF